MNLMSSSNLTKSYCENTIFNFYLVTKMLLFYTFLALNLFAFLIMGHDKYLAKNNKSRISEKALLIFVFIGGTVGSGIGMLIFRHKTSKISFLLKYLGIVIIQLLLIYLFFTNKGM